MGFKHRAYLSGNKVYSCNVCRNHLATIESMISRRFNGQHGQAYLFDAVFNVAEGEAEDRQMTTGLHRVRDISCGKCGQTMGWKYERAYEQSQRYKEGKSILEKALLIETSGQDFALPASVSGTTNNNGNISASASPAPAHAHYAGHAPLYYHTAGTQTAGNAFQAQLISPYPLNSGGTAGTLFGSSPAQASLSGRSASEDSGESN